MPPNPEIQSIVSEISKERIASIEQKLEGFVTRNVYSSTTDPARGIGAARKWIADQFRSDSPRLQVRFDKHTVPAIREQGMFKEVEIWNVIAALPGTSEADREVLVTAHYDSSHAVGKIGKNGQLEFDPEGTAAAVAPGVTDDGSGVAAVLELARVMSKHQFKKTLVFIAFAGEEYKMLGSFAYARDADARHEVIDAVFNNDIIGSDVSGNGQMTNKYVNVYSADPDDSTSRQLARYLKECAERFQPGFAINLVFRYDRFGRGGDHIPFLNHGFPAIRITSAAENFDNQHSETDTYANTSPLYATLVAKADAAAVASLALAPKAPQVTNAEGRPLLRRGTDSPLGYDAVMSWTDPSEPKDLAGYSIVIRNTTSPNWEREIFVGNVLTYTLPNVNIDEVVLGVRAVDRAGNESPVAAYVNPLLNDR